jgi:hypothetical protein
MKKNFSTTEAKNIIDKLGSRLSSKGLEQFRKGLKVELEHGKEEARKKGLNTNVTDDDPVKTGKIALIHINEVPSYYTDLEKMEKRGKKRGELKVIIKKHLNK